MPLIQVKLIEGVFNADENRSSSRQRIRPGRCRRRRHDVPQTCVRSPARSPVQSPV